MPAAADPVMPRAAEPAPMRTAGGLFNGREVFRLRRERCGAALDLGAGAPRNALPIVSAAALASVIASLRIIVLLETFRPWA